MKHALSPYDSDLIPKVYGWNSAKEGSGWIAEEYMPGEPLNKTFPTLPLTKKKRLY